MSPCHHVIMLGRFFRDLRYGEIERKVLEMMTRWSKVFITAGAVGAFVYQADEYNG